MIIFKHSRQMKYHVTEEAKSFCGKFDIYNRAAVYRECNEDELYLLDERGIMCRSCVRIALKEKK